jgi:S1-C subfamily serine protease
VQQDSFAELERLQDQLHAQEQAAAEAGELRTKLAALEEKLAASGATADWAGTAKRYERGMFLCLGIDAPNSKVVLGTAFVVDAAKHIIATNAHVAVEVAQMPVTRYVQAGTGESFEFEGVSVHPRWNRGKGPDLALLRLKPGKHALTALELLPTARLVEMKAGIQVGSLGFPAELAARYLKTGQDDQLSGALPTFKVGWVGRITGMDGSRAEPAESKLIQHSASLTKGTSGSPLFDAQGRVVAVSFAGLGSRSSSSGSEMSTAQIGFGIRADELHDLIASTGW